MSITYEQAVTQLNKISADKQVLELLSATKGFLQADIQRLSAKQLIAVGQELGLSEASVRMALSRQTKVGKLIRNQGFYSIAKQQNAFSLPRFWLNSSKRNIPWQHDWILINATDSKPDTTTARRLTKCSNLLGFRQVANLGYVRPNNLQQLRQEANFHFSTIAPEITWLNANLVNLDEATLQRWQQMWPVEQLNQFYQQGLVFMQQEQTLLSELDAKTILNRSFACGRMIVEQLSIDPWLPDCWVDGQSRQALITQTLEYYQKIMPSWLEIVESEIA